MGAAATSYCIMADLTTFKAHDAIATHTDHVSLLVALETPTRGHEKEMAVASFLGDFGCKGGELFL